MELDAYNSTVLGYVGCALCDVGHLSRGVGILERAVESDPSNAQAWVALGVAHDPRRQGAQGRRPSASRHAAVAARQPLGLLGREPCLCAVPAPHRCEEALEEARLACRRDDKNYIARAVLAMIAADLGRDVEAREAIADALRIRPGLRGGDMLALLGRKGIRLLSEKGLLPA